MVEAAIVVVPLFFVVFAVFEFGVIFKDNLTLSAASRAGARTGAVLPGEGSYLGAVVAAASKEASATKFRNGDTMWVYRAEEDGTPEGSGDACIDDCASYRWQNGSWQLQGSSAPWDMSIPSSCPAPDEYIGVRMRKEHRSLSSFFPTPIDKMKLTGRAVVKVEPLGPSSCGSPSGASTPPSWTWPTTTTTPPWTLPPTTTTLPPWIPPTTTTTTAPPWGWPPSNPPGGGGGGGVNIPGGGGGGGLGPISSPVGGGGGGGLGWISAPVVGGGGSSSGGSGSGGLGWISAPVGGGMG